MRVAHHMVCFQLILRLFALPLSRSRVSRWTLLIRHLLSRFLSHSLSLLYTFVDIFNEYNFPPCKIGRQRGLHRLDCAIRILCPVVRTDARSDEQRRKKMKTKISRIVGLPNFLTHGVPRTRLRYAELRYKRVCHDDWAVWCTRGLALQVSGNTNNV